MKKSEAVNAVKGLLQKYEILSRIERDGMEKAYKINAEALKMALEALEKR